VTVLWGLFCLQAVFIAFFVLSYVFLDRPVLRALNADIKTYKRALLLMPPEAMERLQAVKIAAHAILKEADEQ
jgi:hypothetical protein